MPRAAREQTSQKATTGSRPRTKPIPVPKYNVLPRAPRSERGRTRLTPKLGLHWDWSYVGEVEPVRRHVVRETRSPARQPQYQQRSARKKQDSSCARKSAAAPRREKHQHSAGERRSAKGCRSRRSAMVLRGAKWGGERGHQPTTHTNTHHQLPR